MAQSHAAQHVWRLGELDVLVADNLDAVAPRVEEVEKRAGQGFDPRVGQRFPDCFLVIDDKSKMTRQPVGCDPSGARGIGRQDQ